MCCCGKPTINGDPGYSWDGKTRIIRKPDPPELDDGETLLFDEPGRCGGSDAHCHHYRVVSRYGRLILLVKHGGGTERIQLQAWRHSLDGLLGSMDSNTRFWLLNAIYHTVYSEREKEGKQVRSEWASAFIDKRIKKRKRGGTVSVWVENKVS